jgi:hypothetical protein
VKIAIVVLVLLLLAYIVVLRFGNHGSGGDLKTPSWVKSIGRLTAKPFDTKAIGPGCFDSSSGEFRIEALQLCISRIDAGKDDYRKLELRPLGDATVGVEYRANTDDGSSLSHQDFTLPDPNNPSIVIRRDGGQLTLHCLKPVMRCLVAIQ